VTEVTDCQACAQTARGLTCGVYFCAHGLTRRVGERVLFSDLSLTVNRGEVVVVQAPSGAGKTLLLRLLAWLDPADAGSVELEGVSPPRMGVPTWRSRVVYVGQRPAPLRGCALDFLREVQGFASHRRGRDAVEIAQGWGMAKENWQQPFAKLSGGEQQRLLLAMALSQEPDVLLLDEPTSALDAAVVDTVERTLRGCTAVWVTHDAEQARRVGTRVMELSP